MKLRFLTLFAVALVFGCSKQPSGGTVASNTPSSSPAATSTTTGTATGSTTNINGTLAPTATATGGTTTGSTASSQPPMAGPGPAVSTKSGASPTPTSKSTPGPGGAAIQTTPGAAGGPPGTPPQMTAEQQKKQAEMIAKMKAQQTENAAKAEKATRSTIQGVSGKYVGFIDETRITPEMRKRPNFDQMLAKAKEDIKKATLTVAANGDIIVKGISPEPVNGFTAKIDGKPAVVLMNPKPQAGQPNKQFAPLTVKNSGDIIMLGSAPFKRA